MVFLNVVKIVLNNSHFEGHPWMTCVRQSGILDGFSKVLPNSHFRNGGIKRNWSKISIISLLIV